MFLVLRMGKITTTLAASALLFLCVSCSDKRITQANVNEVTEGMAALRRCSSG